MNDAPTNDAPTNDARVSSALRAAARIESDDWAAAVELLASANRDARADELEFALAALRARGYEQLHGPLGGGPIEAAVSPSVGRSGLPEAAVSELSASVVRAAILGHGSLLVRGAVDPTHARNLADGIDKCYEASDAWSASRDASVRPRSPWWTRFEPQGDKEELAKSWVPGIRNWVRAGGGVLLCDSPRMQFELLDLYRELGLFAVVSEYLGTRPVLSANKCTLRRVGLDATGGWHQDGAFLGTGIRAINLWLALTDCGVDAPGLDLVPRRFDQVVETGTAGSYFTWAAGDELVQEVTGDGGVIRPEFSAGDLLIFDDLLLHRTAVSPEMTHERHAIETWCFAADAYPSGQIPLVW
jgi:hypothetical protein